MTPYEATLKKKNVSGVAGGQIKSQSVGRDFFFFFFFFSSPSHITSPLSNSPSSYHPVRRYEQIRLL